MTDDALARAKRALQLVPRQTGAVAPVDKVKVNDMIARARAAVNKPGLPATVAPRKTVAAVEPARPIEKTRELVPRQAGAVAPVDKAKANDLIARARERASKASAPASSPEPARRDQQGEPPPVQATAPESAPASGPATVVVQVPVPMPWWGYWGPGGWWVGCVSDCPLLRGKRRCRRCGL